MTSAEVLLRLTFDHPVICFSRNNPSFKMFSWCNKESVVHEIVVRDPKEYSLFNRQIPKPPGVVAESYDSEKGHTVLKRCPCVNPSCTKLFDGLAILRLQPTIVEKGWEYHRLIVFKQGALAEYLERLEEAGFTYEILRKAVLGGFIAASMILETNSLFSCLTKKQLDALLMAHRNGYYLWPRKMSAKSIASKKRIPKTTFRDHLRKAENKLIAGLVPYVHLFIDQREEEKKEVKNTRRHIESR